MKKAKKLTPTEKDILKLKAEIFAMREFLCVWERPYVAKRAREIYRELTTQKVN